VPAKMLAPTNRRRRGAARSRSGTACRRWRPAGRLRDSRLFAISSPRLCSRMVHLQALRERCRGQDLDCARFVAEFQDRDRLPCPSRDRSRVRRAGPVGRFPGATGRTVSESWHSASTRRAAEPYVLRAGRSSCWQAMPGNGLPQVVKPQCEAHARLPVTTVDRDQELVARVGRMRIGGRLPLMAVPGTVVVSNRDRPIRGRTQQEHRHVTSVAELSVAACAHSHALPVKCSTGTPSVRRFAAALATFGGNIRAMSHTPFDTRRQKRRILPRRIRSGPQQVKPTLRSFSSQSII